jgi:hypothetical protein
MKNTLVAVAALGLALASSTGASAQAFNPIYNFLAGVYGPKGNDTGGIIPWSPENEKNAFELAQSNCGFYNKFAVATSIHRVPGDYIGYACVWDKPIPVVVHRHHRRVHIKIEK